MIYEYGCIVCDDVIEEVRPVNERDDPCECEDCGALRKRVISKSSFVINGFSEKNGYSDHIGNMMPKHLHGKKYK